MDGENPTMILDNFSDVQKAVYKAFCAGYLLSYYSVSRYTGSAPDLFNTDLSIQLKDRATGSAFGFYSQQEASKK